MSKADQLYLASNDDLVESFFSDNYIYFNTKSVTNIYLVHLHHNIYNIGNKILGLVTKRYLNYLQCFTYIS